MELAIVANGERHALLRVTMDDGAGEYEGRRRCYHAGLRLCGLPYSGFGRIIGGTAAAHPRLWLPQSAHCVAGGFRRRRASFRRGRIKCRHGSCAWSPLRQPPAYSRRHHRWFPFSKLNFYVQLLLSQTLSYLLSFMSDGETGVTGIGRLASLFSEVVPCPAHVGRSRPRLRALR